MVVYVQYIASTWVLDTCSCWPKTKKTTPLGTIDGELDESVSQEPVILIDVITEHNTHDLAESM